MIRRYRIEFTAQYKKGYKRAHRRGLDMSILDTAVEKLACGETLPTSYRDHPLKGKYTGYRECHLRPDWLLVYKIIDDRLILVLADTGTHADLFSM